jgi:uncharacterized protein (TIGR02996 family)
MTQDEAFLQAILEAPDDDVPRRVYADWLLDQGNVRGEFIHAQLDLARMPTSDSRYLGLRAREQELLHRHGHEWARPLRDRIDAWQYQSGFIEKVETNLEDGHGLIALLRLAPIRHLRDSRRISKFHGLVEALPQLDRLTGLEFWKLDAQDHQKVRDLLTSPHLANLRTLILYLAPGAEPVPADVLAQALSSARWANLESLAVNVGGSWTGLSSPEVRVLGRATHLTRMRKLDLSGLGLNDRAAFDALVHAPWLRHLDEIDLGHCQLTLDRWRALLARLGARRRRWLRLAGAWILSRDGDVTGEVEQDDRLREAFESLADEVDWESDEVTPWAGFGWQGQTWQ